MRNKNIAVLLLLILSLSLFVGCNEETAPPAPEAPQTPVEEPVEEAPPKEYPTVKTEYRTTEIPYKVIEEEYNRLAVGETEIKQKGVNGYTSEKVYVTYLGGEIIKEEKAGPNSAEHEYVEPVDEIVLVGTRVDKPLEHTPTKNKPYYSHEKLEQSIFKGINKARTDNGLNALEWSDELHDSASEQSKIIYEGMKYEHGDFEVGENLFFLYPVDLNFNNSEFIVEKWMLSPSHQANILDPEWKITGVDVIIGEQYFPTNGGWTTVMYVTQHFHYE